MIKRAVSRRRRERADCSGSHRRARHSRARPSKVGPASRSWPPACATSQRSAAKEINALKDSVEKVPRVPRSSICRKQALGRWTSDEPPASQEMAEFAR